MKNFTLQLIDFSSIEAANDFIPTFDRKVKNKKLLYQIAFNIELVRYSENFEAWYGQLLLINKELMIKHVTLENCIELGKLLHVVGNSNPKLNQYINDWRNGNVNSLIHDRMIHNVQIYFYSYMRRVKKSVRMEFENNIVGNTDIRVFEINHVKLDDIPKIMNIEDAKSLQRIWLDNARIISERKDEIQYKENIKKYSLNNISWFYCDCFFIVIGFFMLEPLEDYVWYFTKSQQKIIVVTKDSIYSQELDFKGDDCTLAVKDYFLDAWVENLMPMEQLKAMLKNVK